MTTTFDHARLIRVLIADMSPLLSSGIETALGASADFETQRCPIDHVLGGEHTTTPAFDVIVIDGEIGLRLAHPDTRRTLPDSIRGARIFVIKQSNGERDIRSALESGIRGYATMALTHDELREGVRMVARGMRYVCPRTAQRIADSMTREPLTAREGEVLRELALGRCNKTIAQELGMALGTVKSHVRALMSKLDAKTRTQVVTIAITRGLVEMGDRDSASSTMPFASQSSSRPELQLAA